MFSSSDLQQYVQKICTQHHIHNLIRVRVIDDVLHIKYNDPNITPATVVDIFTKILPTIATLINMPVTSVAVKQAPCCGTDCCGCLVI